MLYDQDKSGKISISKKFTQYEQDQIKQGNELCI